MSPNPAACYAVAIVLSIAATIVVGLRYRVRRTKKLSLGWDDYTIFIAMLFVWALGIILIVGTARGSIGTHTQLHPITGLVQVTKHEPEIAKLGFISQLLSIVAYGTLKMSVLLLFRRIFLGKPFKAISLTMCVIVILWTVSFFFATTFQCGRNPTWYWTSPKALAEYCGKYKYILLGHVVSDVATDLIILTIPLPIIWKLHLNTPQRWGLSVVFMLGYISTAAATARVVFMVKDLYETTTGARDVRGNYTNYIVWGFVEAGVGVIAASLPTLRPLLNSRLPESIVNSVRSAPSINSNRSTKRTGSDSENLASHADGVPLSDLDLHGNAGRNHNTHVEGTTRTNSSEIPKNSILMESEYHVH